MTDLLEMLGTAWPILAIGVAGAVWVKAVNRKKKGQASTRRPLSACLRSYLHLSNLK